MHTEIEFRNLLNCSTLHQKTDDVVSFATGLINARSTTEPLIRGVIIDFLKAYDIEISSVMALVSAEAMGVLPTRALNVASAVLFVRTASLLHDVINEPESVSTIGGSRGLDKLLILAGDLLLAEATRIMADHGTHQSMVHLGNGLIQLLRLSARLLSLSTSDDLMDQLEHILKSPQFGVTSFVGEAAIVGALLNEQRAINIDMLRSFATAFGGAFQLVRQASNLELMVKSSARDFPLAFRIGELIYPLAHALGFCSSDEVETMVSSLVHGNVRMFSEIALRLNLIERTRTEANEYLDEASFVLPQVTFKFPEMVYESLKCV
ncbi:MAG: hypothetical protein K9W43_06680 [Candidatus Thorarchaeota archaeon]|nr:hypothetical protein [Candidatus Thorarchaeota archaeon]